MQKAAVLKLSFLTTAGVIGLALVATIFSTQKARGLDGAPADIEIPPIISPTCQNQCPDPSPEQIFLKIDDIKGEANHEHHKDEIGVLSWSIGAEGKQRGQGAGKPEFQNLEIKKRVDLATPELYKALAQGKQIKEVELKIHKAAGDGRGNDYFTIKLSGVFVSSVKTGGSDAEVQTEIVTFSYKKIEMEYKKQKEGESEESKKFKWDVERNREF